MLFLEVPLTVIRSRELFLTAREVASECAFAVNCIDVPAKVLLQCKTLGEGTVGNVALEWTIVALVMLTGNEVSENIGQTWFITYLRSQRRANIMEHVVQLSFLSFF